ncbi:hypothetical protein UB23_27120 [Pseudomonas sp. ES3-33]|nr:hypothetical protein UB23_27120 [Pseudomonas sp. ES3-33]
MKLSVNIRIAILLTIALCIMFIGVPFAGVYDHPVLATYAALSSSFVSFIIFLDLKLDIVLQRAFLIGFGVLYQLIYPKFFYIFVDECLMPADAIDHFNIFGQVILLACSGAGGSIIAVHADKTSSDNQEVPSEKTLVIDNTKHIDQLINSSNKLNEKFNYIIATSLVSALIAVIAIVVALTR